MSLAIMLSVLQNLYAFGRITSMCSKLKYFFIILNMCLITVPLCSIIIQVLPQEL